MDVTQITMSREQARVEYKTYSDALKAGKDAAYIHDLKVAYGHLKRGHPVLDVWQAFKETGFNENGTPKLGIARADWPEVWFVRSDRGDWFKTDNRRWWDRSNHNPMRAGEVVLPRETLPPTPRDAQNRERWTTLRTKVPIIPVRFVPSHGLSNYHILWEVEAWDIVTAPRDPFLLKRVSPNVFVVLAAWDLTELERAVLRGRIA